MNSPSTPFVLLGVATIVVTLTTMQAETPAEASGGREAMLCVMNAGSMDVAASPFACAVHGALEAISDVDGAAGRLPVSSDDGITIHVFAREHGVVSRDQLLLAEDRLSAFFHADVRLAIRAHQGRPVRELAGPNLLFARG